MFDYPPCPLHLFGVKISRDFTQKSFGDEVVVLSKIDPVLSGKLHQLFLSFVVKFRVSGELDVLWHYGGIDDNFFQIFNLHRF